MNSDPASLDRLRDIVELAPVSWWPLAPGWWMLLIVVTVGGTMLGWQAWRRWTGNAYRRAALAELGAATKLEDVSILLKRTALHAFPRSEIAQLSGDAWCRWLAETGAIEVPAGVHKSLAEEVFKGEPAPLDNEILAFAAQWIRDHQLREPGRHVATDARGEVR